MAHLPFRYCLSYCTSFDAFPEFIRLALMPARLSIMFAKFV